MEKEDRRIRRTKRLLRQALAELMDEKEFKDITVKEITERADLNRGTFYFHYTDTYDLREKIEDELVRNFQEVLSSYSPTPENYSAREMLEQAVKFVEEQKFLIRVLFSSHAGQSLQTKFMSVIEELIAQVGTRLYPEDDNYHQSKYRCRFLSYGVIGCLNLWLQDEGKMSSRTLVDDLDRMINSIIGKRS